MFAKPLFNDYNKIPVSRLTNRCFVILLHGEHLRKVAVVVAVDTTLLLLRIGDEAETTAAPEDG